MNAHTAVLDAMRKAAAVENARMNATGRGFGDAPRPNTQRRPGYGELSDQALELLRRHPSGLSRAQIVEATGASRSAVGQALRNLTDAGKVWRFGTGTAANPYSYRVRT